MTGPDDSSHEERPADLGTPTSRTGQEFCSWAQASKHFVVPRENRDFIAHICERIGVERFVPIASDGYLKAIRRDGRADLRIHPGYTNGFLSQEEARSVTGSDANVWESARKGLWGVSHPVNQIGQGSGVRSKKERDYGLCPHNLALPASGVCEC
jgi:hypothetical protein